jgi:hypothetical protein
MNDPAFATLLGPERLAELEANAHTVIGLRPDDTVAYRNGGWTRFAMENGAPEFARWNGTPILEVFHPEVRDTYRALFERVRAQGAPEDHVYQCSSPESYREFRLRVLPLPKRHLLLIHHLVVDREHHWPAYEPGPTYVGPHGVVTQCCHCRRTRRADAPDTWDWVPADLDRTLDEVSHGLCPPCFRHYHPEAAALRDQRKT